MSQDKPVVAQEPIGYWHQGETDEESDFFPVSYCHGAGSDCPDCIPLYDHAVPCARCSELVPVEKEDANNYCWILSLLGMEEEGDPIHEIERLLALREGMVCADCNNTGWLENREEGRYPCTCMTEADPYHELQAKITEHASIVNYLRLRVEQFDRAISRIGHHLHLTLAGVDTEDEHGPGGHSAEAICRKFDKQAERIKDLEALSMQSNQDHLNARKDYRTKLAKADAVILKVKSVLTSIAEYANAAAIHNARYALAAIEAYQKGE